MSYQYAESYATPRDDNPLRKAWQRLVRQSQYDVKGRPRTKLAIIRRRLLRLPTIVVVLWIFVLHWGERSLFSSSIEACEWDNWEQWPSDAQPHRIALIADPQLVDPHTYPGRPWPLSSLTIAATDKYIKRSYRLLQRHMDPDTVFFLGDLFDGGREWSTHHPGFQASEKQWLKYGDNYWWNEYNRFGNIFFEQNQVTGGLPAHKTKKLIASLPGNHDLGFANGVQIPIRNRFQAFFGESDRIDIVGNHTFVSLDSVSLSAFGQPDSLPLVWNSTIQFLGQAQDLKHKAVRTELALRQGLSPNPKYPHVVKTHTELAEQPVKKAVEESKPEFPTVLLSHVPLFRDIGTPCGPLREKYPPKAPNLPFDEPNAIRVAAGYQYQNVLTRDLSTTIAEKVGNIAYAFSGDDHDYCEVIHRGYASAGGRGIREITVKSISWAMGVRKPGFQLVSLWNPVDSEGNSLRPASEPTMKTHLCLLPDQLSTFIRYAFLAVFSLVFIAVYTVFEGIKERNSSATASTELPTSEPAKFKEDVFKPRSRAPSGSANSISYDSIGGRLSARSNNARTRSVSPSSSMGYSLPTVRPGGTLIEKAGYYGHNPEYQSHNRDDGDETDEWGNPFVEKKPPEPPKPKTFARKLLDRFGHNFAWTAGPVFFVYYILLKCG